MWKLNSRFRQMNAVSTCNYINIYGSHFIGDLKFHLQIVLHLCLEVL